MTYKNLTERVSSIRLELSKLQQVIGGMINIRGSAILPNSLTERRPMAMESYVLESAGGQIGIGHFHLGYYRKALDTDNLSYPYSKNIRSLSEIKPAIDRVDKHHALVRVEDELIITSMYQELNYTVPNRFEKIIFVRDKIEGIIQEIMELPLHTEEGVFIDMARIQRDAAVAGLTLAKALVGEHYQELMEINSKAKNFELTE